MSDWKLDSAALDRYITGNYGEDQDIADDETPAPPCEILQSPNGDNGGCDEEGTYTCDRCGIRICGLHTWTEGAAILCAGCFGVYGLESPRKVV
jgi:hypothetical protein